VQLLDTEQAIARLAEIGIRRTSRTLRKMRHDGDGPRYRVFNRRAYYVAEDLVAWVEEGLSEPRRKCAEG
jgi:hypothetical protein